MTNLLAKPVIKDKFWIVESSGEKIATIQAVENGGVVYVDYEARTPYPSIKVLSREHDIVFDKPAKKKSRDKDLLVYGYPVRGRAWNKLWDIKRRFPIFTKTRNSKSFFCAGYYLIKQKDVWSEAFCPKFISLNRYEFKGPFKTKEEMKAAANA